MPFGTAVWYSLQRYNLNLPMLRGFIWFEQYVQLFQSGAFWNTVRVSLLYAVLTVGVELCSAWASRSCCAARPGSTTRSRSRSCCR